LQIAVTSLTSDKTTLQAQVTTLQANVTSLTSDKTTLQSDKTTLQSQVASLQSDNAKLRQDITTLTALLAIQGKNYTVGSVLTTFSGGYEDKTGPAFHIPAGNVQIIAQLTSLGSTRTFYLYLYKVGGNYSTWIEHTENAGTYINYVYSLESGDYYLDVASVNFNWQITVYVYGTCCLG
jgi:FtsZ-binding cell division protein ZapB